MKALSTGIFILTMTASGVFTGNCAKHNKANLEAMACEAGFLAFTSLSRFNGGFETSAESFWEHFEVAKIDIIEELNWLQEREMRTN